MTKKEERFWDKSAAKYSKSPIKDQEGYEKTLSDTRKHLKGHMSVLEIGCGTGTTALQLSDSGANIMGTDISSNMIAIAREKAREQNCVNVKFLKAAIFDERLGKESFDAILAFNVMHLLDNISGVIKRVSELLKPGGIFISKTPCLKEKSWVWPILVPVMATVMRVGPVSCFTLSGLKEAVTDEGFDIVETFVQPVKPLKLFFVARKIS